MEKNLKLKKWGWLVLFASTSTLLCCALPILLVSLGAGAVVASFATQVPFLVTLSMHKAWVFAGSGLMLLLGGWALYRSGRICPSDPDLGKLCDTAHKWNRRLYWVSVTIWCVGFFFAFIAVKMFY